MRIPFDIKFRPQIESGEYKVVNSYGEPVRIICWDARIDFPNGIRPIISLQLIDEKYEVVSNHLKNGKIYSFKDAPADLFIVTPEEELTEFEQEVSDIVEYCKEHGEHVAFDYAKRHAKTLLAIAEKEIAKGHEHDVYIPEDTYYEQLKKQWEEGYDKGKVEALKDLPRWKLYRRGSKIDPSSVVRFKDGAVGRTKCALEDCYVLEEEEMLKLSPFNEEKK